ncbi:hybrid sensor histidine kinase/response regulator [Candidatus Parabeggiatoa sp. HSG14]|uniref:hybrid sensor histidine kinase/response regulator n=1 Tax=Candidatus Parabeggiatoa sp. HSG14 TaxID=3055593 RepID=UPI0025A7ABEF|nr:hybrid sensor histidine kinase/response regulator [Thiotrichales bacterium HSG14]
MSKGDILVVDDIPDNLRLLASILTKQGYKVRLAPSGTLVFMSIQSTKPDLILLDIKMPDMDGYEVCKQLKVDEQTRDIPVIFLSALHEAIDKVKAFTVGGVDYITKPFQTEEVLARIETHLALRLLQKRLQKNNKQLQYEIAERKQTEEVLRHEITERKQVEEILRQRNEELANTLQQLKTTQQQLVEAEKIAALGNLVAGVAHEINTPVGIGMTMTSHLDTLTQEFTELYKNGSMTRKKLEKYLNTVQQSSVLIFRNLTRAAELTKTFKQIAVDRSSEQPGTLMLKEYLSDIVNNLEPVLKRAQHQISIVCDDKIKVTTYPSALFQIITNLVMNSIQHGFKDRLNGIIRIEVTYHSGKFVEKVPNKRITLHYFDDGNGIEAGIINNIFEPFVTTNRQWGSTGLGLHIVYNLVTYKLKGSIDCESIEGQGTDFVISLPILVVDN